jgi:hypothetical protein
VLCAMDALNALIAGGAHGLCDTQQQTWTQAQHDTPNWVWMTADSILLGVQSSILLAVASFPR